MFSGAEVVMEFATLPPETNSGRMYSGPGAGSMMKAARAWDRLAAALHAAAAQTGMTQATAPYIDWLNTTAARAAHAASQAAAVAGAHRSALATMVPPPVITANRARQRSLGALNCLGQTGPAIAEIDAEYERMWARDADAMYAYADAAADAAALAPFTSPPGNQGATTHTWALQSAPDVLSAGGRVMSTIPEALQAFSRSPLTPLEASLSPMTAPLSRLSSLSAPSDAALKHLNALNKGAALRSLFTRPARGGRGAATAGFGGAAAVGGLSVPQAWATARAPIAVYRGTVA
jgi:PPE family/PPE-SVP subfamily C-terminal region